MSRELHIISLDVPYPVDHGGQFDLFCKLQALQEAGIGIHLHCFEYGRGAQPALEQYCLSVQYYPRRTGLRGFSFSTPYIVHSRQNAALAKRLLQDSHPILMEGIHCTALLADARFRQRNILVRLHNVEYEYYRQLANMERNWLRRLYLRHESRLLEKYEASIAKRALFVTVSEKDAATYRQRFGAKATFLPVFVPWQTPQSLPGSGHYCLYHGNLSVPENERAATWLMEEVFAGSGISFVIAGRNPSGRLRRAAGSLANVRLVANPSSAGMAALIQQAQINLLPSFNTTGVKLKLLHALFSGRHCMTGRQAAEDAGVEACCHIADGTAAIKAAIEQLMMESFTQDMIAQRSAMLLAVYDNQANARRLTGLIW